MFKLFKIIIFIFIFSFLAQAQNERPSDALSDEDLACLQRGLGSTSEVVLMDISKCIKGDALINAFYHKEDYIRLISIDAAGYADDPRPYLPYLAALGGSNQRRTAYKAMDSLTKALQRLSTNIDSSLSLIPKEAGALDKIFIKLAKDKKLESDIRIAAIRARRFIFEVSSHDTPSLEVLLKDRNELVRMAVLSALPVPLNESQVSAVGEVALRDDSFNIRGQAVYMLCENAISHGVDSPSVDLRELLVSVLKKSSDLNEAIWALLCISKFQYSSRADLTDIILNHSDPEVVSHWKTLVKGE